MKTSISVLLLLIIDYSAQAQDYLDDVAQEACECLQELPDSLDSETFQMEFGLCLLNASQPYQKKIKKDYKLDIAKLDRDAEELGKIIGLRMASVCPTDILALAKKFEGELEEEESNPSPQKLRGTLVKIDGEKFLELSVKDENGKIGKFQWLDFVDSEMDLTNSYEELLNQEVLVHFENRDLFDARLNEYRSFQVILEIELLD